MRGLPELTKGTLQEQSIFSGQSEKSVANYAVSVILNAVKNDRTVIKKLYTTGFSD